MVIFIPMPSSTAGLGPYRERPSKVGLGASAALLAGYLSIPLYSRPLLIDLPQAFGLQVSTSGIQGFSILLGAVLIFAYLFTGFFTLLAAVKVNWWEWTLYCLSIGLVLFWILPLIAAGNNLALDFCREIGFSGSEAWAAGCY